MTQTNASRWPKIGTLTPNKGKLGVCVLNWNAGEVLRECVRNVYYYTGDRDIELVVVDNASTDSSVRLLRETFPEIAIIETCSNIGYARGNNLGAQQLVRAGCDSLLFVNPDVVLHALTIEHLLSELATRPDIGCVGGLPLKPDGSVCVTAIRSKPTFLQKLISYSPLRHLPVLSGVSRKHLLDSLPETSHNSVYAVCGACILFRAEAFVAIGGFDEYTFLYEEEFIVSEKLIKDGWSVAFASAAAYEHSEGLCSRLIPFRRRIHFLRSELYLARHYYGWSAVLCGLLAFHRAMEFVFLVPLVQLIKHTLGR